MSVVRQTIQFEYDIVENSFDMLISQESFAVMFKTMEALKTSGDSIELISSKNENSILEIRLISGDGSKPITLDLVDTWRLRLSASKFYIDQYKGMVKRLWEQQIDHIHLEPLGFDSLDISDLVFVNNDWTG